MRSQQSALYEQCRHPSGLDADITLAEMEQSVPVRFAKMVAQYADRVAITDPSHQCTYAELDLASNRVARAIRQRVGGADNPVAILSDRGVGLAAAIYGVVKAGMCHFIVPPDTPAERLAFIFQDLDCRLLISDSRNLELAKLLATGATSLLLLEEALQSESTEPVRVDTGSDTPYIVRYTSGSTGRPKGVLHLHRDFLFFSRTRIRATRLCPEDRVSFFGPRFLTAITTTMAGGSYFELDLRRAGLAAVGQRMAYQTITVWGGMTTTFRQLVRSTEPDLSYPDVRLVFMGGEPPTPHDIRAAQRFFSPRCVYVNSYGTSESNNVAAYYADAASAARLESLPIGYPTEGVDILLYDDAGNIVPEGEVGEIAIRSRYLSAGYWKRPELTHERFLADPDDAGTGVTPRRIYITGDLGRRDADGLLYHLGRKDHQVKIRGHRIEIPEIEAELMDIPGVRAAAVAARPGPNGDPRLIAYVVPTVEGVTVTMLRQALSARLPLAFVPAAFVFLDKLPQTATFKVDRMALPLPGKERPALAVAYVAPRTPLEGQLAEIWAEVLGIDQIGVEDSFLELGGDSLLASQIMTRVIRTLHVHLPISLLKAAPTVAAMAKVVLDAQLHLATPEEIESLLAEVMAELTIEIPA